MPAAHASDRPFVDVGVSAISKGNAARELFGSEQDGEIQYGRLEQAAGGTLYLDEVADMDLEVQAQLVGALDTGAFLRVGGTAPVSIDVRVVAATRHDLQQAVERGTFREDLFYQLNVVPLGRAAAARAPRGHPRVARKRGRPAGRAGQAAVPAFFHRGAEPAAPSHWPGNVRELKNLVQRVLILGTGDEIGPQEVEQALGAVQAASAAQGMPGVSFDQPLRDARDAFEKAYLEYQFDKHGGNVSQMAEEAGMERTHLYRKLRDRGIEIKDRR
jgi:two-component system nitrogen regulation response regulator NtrX